MGFGLNVIKALSQDSLCLIKDIIANPHPTTPYEILKDTLLNNNSLTDFQNIESQFKMGEIRSQQKPSELLAHTGAHTGGRVGDQVSHFSLYSTASQDPEDAAG